MRIQNETHPQISLLLRRFAVRAPPRLSHLQGTAAHLKCVCVCVQVSAQCYMCIYYAAGVVSRLKLSRLPAPCYACDA
jgi:hypothetical protein